MNVLELIEKLEELDHTIEEDVDESGYNLPAGLTEKQWFISYKDRKIQMMKYSCYKNWEGLINQKDYIGKLYD